MTCAAVEDVAGRPTTSEIRQRRTVVPAVRRRQLEAQATGERAALYLRVSSKGQLDGHSLDAQLDDARGYCDALGYHVVRIIRDVGSATSNDLDERPGLQLLLALADRKAFDVLVVWDRSRFTRGPLGQLIEDDLRSAGIRVEATTTGPRERTDETELQDGVQDLFARWEARKITVRNTRGRLQAAAKGLWPTEAPFGYRKEVPNKASRLVLEPYEARLMRDAYTMYLSGHNRERVGQYLGVSKWSVINRLRSPTYKGLAMYKGIPVPCPGVVDADTWQQVQELIVARRNTPLHRKPAYSRKESWLGPPQALNAMKQDQDEAGQPVDLVRDLVGVDPAHAEEQGHPGQDALVPADVRRLDEESDEGA